MSSAKTLTLEALTEKCVPCNGQGYEHHDCDSFDCGQGIRDCFACKGTGRSPKPEFNEILKYMKEYLR